MIWHIHIPYEQSHANQKTKYGSSSIYREESTILIHTITIAAALFISIALLSYNHSDAGLPSVTEDGFTEPRKTEAYIADILFYFWDRRISSTDNDVNHLLEKAVKTVVSIVTVIGSLLLFVAIDGLLALHIPLQSFLLVSVAP